MMNEEWRGNTIPFDFERDASKWRGNTIPFNLKNDASEKNIFMQIRELRDKRGEQWFDTPMLIEDCIRVFGYERDILFLTHIANTLMEDKQLRCSESIALVLDDILTAIQQLHDNANADMYPVKHDIHVISEKIRSFVSEQRR